MSDWNKDGIERLAGKVLSGEVVFFVGAGFSLDSEHNTAQRLIGRLLIRFEAMTVFFITSGKRSAVDKASSLQTALQKTFSIVPKSGNSFCANKDAFKENTGKLAKEYYLINDWMCSAYSSLLGLFDMPDKNKAATVINRIENRIRQRSSDDSTALEKMDLAKILKLPSRDRGKALFLDTMGFANPEIMGGVLDEKCMDKVIASFRDRLLPRHHVLARLAREGLCPLLVTTNYDLLLEGAYLLAGFEYHNLRQHSAKSENSPTHPCHSFAKVACARDFFRFGNGQRAALILKMHGCVASYREAREKSEENDQLKDYLPSMVFTFREIQNWRNDAWSRDFLRTLLRTRTIAFCGYSGQDAVVHDTFRTVSEEMACYCQSYPTNASGAVDCDCEHKKETPTSYPTNASGAVDCDCELKKTPTFYFGGMDDMGFHGLEMLRASSMAIGVKQPKLTGHANYLRFHFRSRDKARSAEFPDIDDLMRWLFHQTFRCRQEQLLHTSLATMVSMLLGHPCPKREFDQLKEHFTALRAAENEAVEDCARDCFERVVAWTMHFQAGLLREMVETEQMAIQNGPSRLYWQGRKRPHLYHAAANHPGLAAWAIVVEVAVRRMIACWRNIPPENWVKDDAWVVPGQGWSPSLNFSLNDKAPTPICLSIGMDWRPDSAGRMPPARGAFRKIIAWNLYPHAMPCKPQNGLPMVRAGKTPSAKLLWEVATCATERIDNYQAEIKSLFGDGR